MTKLRVGFLVDDLRINSYCYELIEFVEANNAFDSPFVITGHKNNSRGFSAKSVPAILKKFDTLLKIVLFRLISILESKKVKKKYPKYQEYRSIENHQNLRIINIQGNWSNSRLFLELTDDDLKLISKYDLDCIVRCGSGILRGGILDISRFGVISFHHGDNRVIRGGPSGFWEVLQDIPSSGFVIQKLNEELDGGVVLARGNIMTRKFWLENNAHLLEKSNVFMMKVLLKLAETKKLDVCESLVLCGNTLYKLDSSLPLLKYFVKISLPAILQSLYSRLRSYKTTRWSVSYAYHQNFSKSLWRYQEIKNPKGRFLADPCVFEHNCKNFLFVEDFSYQEKKGRISAIKVDECGHEFLGIVLEENFHLSFPFVFKRENEIYMIPETSSNKDIRLYRSTDFPLKWKFEMQLMADVDAADTVVFQENGVWFLLTNLCSANIGDHHSELHVFYSDDLFSKDWLPVKSGNPVIFDSLKARNGGYFCFDGKAYRISQSHGKNHYGKGFKLNQIMEVSKEGYIEKEICSILPNFKSDAISTHHFSACREVAAIDFARNIRLNADGCPRRD